MRPQTALREYRRALAASAAKPRLVRGERELLLACGNRPPMRMRFKVTDDGRVLTAGGGVRALSAERFLRERGIDPTSTPFVTAFDPTLVTVTAAGDLEETVRRSREKMLGPKDATELQKMLWALYERARKAAPPPPPPPKPKKKAKAVPVAAAVTRQLQALGVRAELAAIDHHLVGQRPSRKRGRAQRVFVESAARRRLREAQLAVLREESDQR